MFTNTTCPGDYLRSKMQYIADEANKINGYSFFITVDNLRTWNLKFISGSSERLLEILRLIREHHKLSYKRIQPAQQPESAFRRILRKFMSIICRKS